MITCLKTFFVEILYYKNKLYNKIIYLDLYKKTLEAATKSCSENDDCVNYAKYSGKIPVKKLTFFTSMLEVF